jgi:hypothetical protein
MKGLLQPDIRSIASHPAGVFNSMLVGVIVAMLTAQYVSSQSGNMSFAHGSATEFLGGVATSLVMCSLGGVLGEAKRHYLRSTA